MSCAVVPGRILRVGLPFPTPAALGSTRSLDTDAATALALLRLGDREPNWTSVSGGGLGRRGELEGDKGAPAVLVVMAG